MAESRVAVYSIPSTEVSDLSEKELRVTTAQHLAWARLLQHKRNLLGLTLHDMVTRTGFSEATVRSYERQFSPGMKMGAFLRVLQAYEIETSEAAAALGMRMDPAQQNTPTARRIRALINEIEQCVDGPHADHILSVFEEFLRGFRRAGESPV